MLAAAGTRIAGPHSTSTASKSTASQVDHCCPSGPNTLCVQHLQAVTQLQNLELQWGRRLWGWDEWRDPDEPEPDPNAIPFHLPPAWLRPFLGRQQQECPF